MSARLKNADYFLVISAIVFLLGAPFIGVLDIDFAQLFDFSAENVNAQVFWSLRIPRVVAGFLIGAALALCGVTFQALFHNPLASPFTLGVSSGAACGVAISVVCGFSLPFAGISPHSLAALLGALLTIVLVHTAGRNRLGLSGVSMLLVGVIINFFFGSIVVFLQYLSDLTQLFSLMRWLMGV